MSCKVSKFDICRLVQESYKSPTFDFGSVDISEDTFIYRIKQAVNDNGAISMQWVEYPTTIIENKVVINEFELLKGNYQHEFLRIHNGFRKLIFNGALTITDKSNSGCTPCKSKIIVNDCNEVLKINYSETIINFGVDFSIDVFIEALENATEEQIERINELLNPTPPDNRTHLRFDTSKSIDAGNETKTIILPITDTSNLTIDWGDGTINNNVSHTYAEHGIYDVKIEGVLPDFNYFELYFSDDNWVQSSMITHVFNFQNLENLINCIGMFAGCSNLTTIPLFDTSNSTSMEGMFAICSSLTTIPLLDTSNVTNMSYMLSSCSSLTTIPLLDTSNVTTMNNMLAGCSNLTTIPLLDTSSVTNMSGMFYETNFNGDLTQWCVINITSEPEDFGGAPDWTTKPIWGTCPSQDV